VNLKEKSRAALQKTNPAQKIYFSKKFAYN